MLKDIKKLYPVFGLRPYIFLFSWAAILLIGKSMVKNGQPTWWLMGFMFVTGCFANILFDICTGRKVKYIFNEPFYKPAEDIYHVLDLLNHSMLKVFPQPLAVHWGSSYDFETTYAGKHSATETILCSAIKSGLTIYAVEAPARHYHVVRAMVQLGVENPALGEKGFITSSGRFVDRKEALDIAMYAGQLIDSESLASPDNELYAEDMWVEYVPGTPSAFKEDTRGLTLY